MSEPKPGSVTLLPDDPMRVYQPPDLRAAPIPINSQGVLLQVISRVAGDPNIDLDRVERLLVMHEKLAARDAEQQFTRAMADFKRDPPKIIKDKLVSYVGVSYKHATLGAVVAAAIEGLGKVGISHRWNLEQLQGGRVRVTCILTHLAGHSQSTVLEGQPDDSGKKNAIQQVASTISYLERYTLLAATGLATAEQDDDGRGAGEPEREPDPPPEGYESWVADMDLIEDEAALKKAWNGSSGIFRGWATSADAGWWASRREAAKLGMTTGAFLKQRQS